MFRSLILVLVIIGPVVAPAQQGSDEEVRLTRESLQAQQARPREIARQEPTAPLASAIPGQPQLPPGFPLAQDHADYVVKLLEAWESISTKINRCTVEFQRTEYNPEVCNWRDPKTGHLAGCTVIQGEIRYQSPDKAFYEAERFWDYAGPPTREGENPQYKPRTDTDLSHEKWICDGESVYEYDFKEKRLYESVIPPEYRGEGLVNSPLPFVFGAKKEVLLERYWIKVITPRNVDNEYWLEIYPKRASDAQDYQKIQLVLSREDFLPRSMHLFAPNYDEVKNPVSRHVEFGNRRINGQIPAIATFLNLFIRPNTPLGWERVDRSIPSVETDANANSSGLPGKVNR